MIESRCEACGGRIVLPDPPPKSREEVAAFAREWDRRYEENNTAEEKSYAAFVISGGNPQLRPK